MRQRHHRPKGQDSPQTTLTRAVTHIRLPEANSGKLAALDELAQVYLSLCQQYVTLFCTEKTPDKFHPPIFETPLSDIVGVDVGIANFLTTSTGKHYGTFHGKLRERQKRDREKRRRKAKLRACLKKKSVQKLPSISSRTGQRLARHVRQEINRAVNE